MDTTKNDSLEAEGIFVGKPSKQDLINYFMKQQSLATIKKLEENDRDISPELSESFEIYLEQKKQKIEAEKLKLAQNIPIVANNSPVITINDDPIEVSSFVADESFLEMEKLCENTLNLNNVSEILNDLTTLDVNRNEETQLFEIEQPSLMDDTITSPHKLALKNIHENRPSTIAEVTEMSLSYKTAQTSNQSNAYTEKSECYMTATDKTIGLTTSNFSTNTQNRSVNLEESIENNDIKDTSEPSLPMLNDTLDEIEFLLSQAQKMNNKPVTKQKNEAANLSPFRSVNSPMCEKNLKSIKTPKRSPLITFSPAGNSNSPSSFKLPKLPTSSSKQTNFSKINSKKFQHIVSPVSRYIQTSESVLNKNAHINYDGSAKRHFNFRDSENFNKTIDRSVNVPSLPLRAKTKNTDAKITQHSNASDKFQKDTSDIFANNTFNDSEVNDRKLADLSLISENASIYHHK